MSGLNPRLFPGPLPAGVYYPGQIVGQDPFVNTLSNPNFGRINGGSAGRNIQLALNYAF